MGSLAYITRLFVQIIALISLLHSSSAARHLTELVREDPQLLHYHKGSLLYGNISVNLIWYGDFKPSQRAIIVDFISSLSSTSSPKNKNTPSVSDWWKITEKYYHLTTPKRSPAVSLSLGKQIVDRTYSLGKSLTTKQIVQLASRGAQRNAINIVLTAQNVAVEGFCMSRCGTHGSSASRSFGAPIKRSKFAYIWVGDSETQCPGQCAWPFHQPIYGPQAPPLVAPNGDVGLDGIVMNLAGLLAGTATNPFGNGFFQGEAGAPLEAASACPGMFGSGAYPGNPGKVLVDSASGGSYNALGVNGRKYMLPALYDPTTSSCSTLV